MAVCLMTVAMVILVCSPLLLHHYVRIIHASQAITACSVSPFANWWLRPVARPSCPVDQILDLLWGAWPDQFASKMLRRSSTVSLDGKRLSQGSFDFDYYGYFIVMPGSILMVWYSTL